MNSHSYNASKRGPVQNIVSAAVHYGAPAKASRNQALEAETVLAELHRQADAKAAAKAGWVKAVAVQNARNGVSDEGSAADQHGWSKVVAKLNKDAGLASSS